MRQTGTARKPGAPIVDLIHQIECLNRRIQRRGQADRRRIVDAYVNPTECFDGLSDRRFDLILEADIALDRQSLASGFSDLISRGVDCAGKPGVRFARFSGNHDSCAVAGSTQGDGQADTPAAACDK